MKKYFICFLLALGMNLCLSGAELLLEILTSRFDVQHSMKFSRFPFWGKGCQFDGSTEFFQVYFLKLHGALRNIGCKGTK